MAQGLAVVGLGIVQVETERAGLIGQAPECGFSLTELVVGQKGGGGAQAGDDLGCLNHKGGFFRSSFFAGLEVLADADAGEPAGDSPRDRTVAVIEPGQASHGIGHVKVATSTSNLTLKTHRSENKSGAREGTRTLTPFGTRPSNVCVYQFHHPSISNEGKED